MPDLEAIIDNGGAAIVSTRGDSPLRRQRNDSACAIDNLAYVESLIMWSLA